MQEQRKEEGDEHDAFVRAVTENRIDVHTHPGFRIDVDFKAIGEACAAVGTYMELSSRHRTPDLKGAEAAANAGAKFIINSDAHKPALVGKCDYALELADKLGLGEDEVVNVSDRPVVFRRGLEV